MSGFGDIWDDLVRNFFPDAEEDEDDGSPRKFSPSGDTFAAPSSVYQPDRSVYDSSSVYNADRSAYETSVYNVDRSTYESYYAGNATGYDSSRPRSPRRAEKDTFVYPGATGLRSFAEPRNANFDKENAESPKENALWADIHIPFKDGSSQIMMRPKFGPQGMETPDPQMNLQGASFLRSDAYRAREGQFFISDIEDVVDVQIAEYFKAKPEVYLKTKLTRIRPGVYSMYGRQIEIEWKEASAHRRKGQLVVKDGPLRQPLADYLENKDNTAEYNSSIFQAKNNLQAIPKEDRVTFDDPSQYYSRVHAMKMANDQAVKREAAAMHMKAVNLEAKEQLQKAVESIRLGKQIGRPVPEPLSCTMKNTPRAQMRTEAQSPAVRRGYSPISRSTRASVVAGVGMPASVRLAPSRSGTSSCNSWNIRSANSSTSLK